MHGCRFHSGGRLGLNGGVTIVEMSVVIAVIGTLASLLLPGLHKAKSNTRSIDCINNLKQLQLAWQLYADDNNDVLPPNNWLRPDWGDGCPQGLPAVSGAWVLGSTLTDRSGW